MARQQFKQKVEAEAAKLDAKVFDLLDFSAYTEPGDLGELMRISDFPEEQLYMAAWSDVGSRRLFVELPIKTELGAMIAMHELGHIATTRPGQETSIEVEAKATCWGIAHMAVKISAATASNMLAAITEYEIELGQPIRPGSIAYELKTKLLACGASEEEARKIRERLNA